MYCVFKCRIYLTRHIKGCIIGVEVKMTKDEAIEKFFPMVDDTTFGKMFISSLYGAGYMIITPEELSKISGGTNEYKRKIK